VEQLPLHHANAVGLSADATVVDNDASPARAQTFDDVLAGEASPTGDHDCVLRSFPRAACPRHVVAGGRSTAQDTSAPHGWSMKKTHSPFGSRRMTSIPW